MVDTIGGSGCTFADWLFSVAGSQGPVGPAGPTGATGAIGPSGAGGAIVAATPPAGASDSALWWDSDSGVLAVRYNDGNSTAWVQIGASAGGVGGGGPFLPLAGGVMTGPLALAANSTAPTPAIADISTKIATTAFVNQAQMIANGIDLNTIKAPGTYCCLGTGTTNGPVAGGQWYIEVLVYGGSPTQYLIQVAYDLTSTGNAWTRVCLAGNWAAWLPLGSGGSPGTAVVRSYLAGLTLTWLSAGLFSVAAGVAADSTNAVMMTLAAAMNKTAAAWSAGNNGGALDTGTIAAAAWYHVFLIRNPTTSVVDVVFSATTTPNAGPTALPSGYTQFRRIGSMKTTSGAWTQFTQLGDEFLWASAVNDVNVATLSTTAILFVLTVPSNINVTARFRGYFISTSPSSIGLINSPDETSVAALTPAGNATRRFTP